MRYNPRASPWTLTIVVATLADFVVRFALPFDMKRVLLTEAVLFPVTGCVLLWLARKYPRRQGWQRVLQWVLVIAFFLGGMRSGLWGLGFPVMLANLVPLAIAVTGLAGLVIQRRLTRAEKA